MSNVTRFDAAARKAGHGDGVMNVLSYVQQGLTSFERDPAHNEYAEGYHEALKELERYCLDQLPPKNTA